MIIAIDPSTTSCGASIMEVTEGQTVSVAETLLIKASSAFNEEEGNKALQLGPRTVRIQRITDRLNELCDRYTLTHIVVEESFFAPGKPNSHAALVEIVFGIKVFVAMTRDLPVVMIENRTVKRVFSSVGNINKEGMRTALVKHCENGLIHLPEKKVVDDLSEHEIDAVAVGFTHFVTQIPTT